MSALSNGARSTGSAPSNGSAPRSPSEGSTDSPFGRQPNDPLAALRAADHRPRLVIWREQVVGQMRSVLANGPPVALRRVGTGLLGVAVVVAIGWRLFVTSAPPVEDSIPIVARNAPTTSTAAIAPVASGETSIVEREVVVVHVAGAVRRPGLVEGTEGWRVADALKEAGGPLRAADLDRLNLAAHLADGQRIFVPEVGEAEPGVVAASTPSAVGGMADAMVDLNTADSAALETLPGIGPATAAAIISHRESHGRFATVDALVAVRGIGPATLEQIRDRVVAG